MTVLRDTLLTQLARFDDDAFAALANRGLLRRAYKDLETHAPQIADETADVLTVAFAGQQIRFDARGPAQAQCGCPASGVCQHLLGAAIGLRQLLQADGAASASASDQGENEVPADGSTAREAASPVDGLRDALLAFSHAQLVKHAGKTGYRWAWQFVQDLDGERDVRLGGERNVVIDILRPRMSLRYMGGPLESLVLDTQTAQAAKYQVAAVLVFQRAHGVAIREPDAPGRTAPGTLDLGKDHAVATVGALALADSRERLRAAVSQLLQESLTLGLSHLSEAMQQRYATLAVWAQGAEYYRLALLLRRLADHVELLLERAGQADEHVLLDEISLTYGLVQALAAAGPGGAPSHLVGRARTRYESAGALELLGLGASAWRSASGYVGLTMLFWSPADRCFVSCSDARPESQGGFNPVARYKAVGPWSGLGAPAQATGRQVLLTHAQLNAGGRVSAAESTHAVVKAMSTTDFRAQLQPWTHWAALREARQSRRRSLLAEARPMDDWAVLQPARAGAAHFDTTRQQLTWPVFDEAGDVLVIALPYSTYNEHAIARIEQLADGSWHPGDYLVARLRDGASGLTGEPLSVVMAHAVGDATPVDALHFDAGAAPGKLEAWLKKLRNAPVDDTVVNEPEPIGVFPARLRGFRQWLRHQAERGIGDDARIRIGQEYDAWQEKLVRAGFSVFGGLNVQHMAARLLAANYVAMQCERMLSAGTDEVIGA
ncbi:hypothetical protein [Dyella sp.]|uniref:hypothetical protein n=1 Tax=Dyella sp. TaxID=1869338 RepID=UPI002ED4DA80